MRLHEFLSLFEENTKIILIDNNEILTTNSAGNITQKYLNCRIVKKCELENDTLLIYTEIKT